MKKGQDPFDLGREQFRGGNFPGALDSFTQAIQADPLRSEAYRLRALVRAALSDPRGSESDFAKAIETSMLDEAAEAIHVDRGITRFGRGDLRGARLDLEHALRLDANDRRAIDYLRKLGQADGTPPGSP